ncbi:Vacuolar protein sorting-associated protein 52 B [Ceratocystis fimbriata CBS 114723]|uniref:Vacuolar protein sorting-associated protein 52 B n=1 Tax=Ceratocystis fimbriata CBS 114723 TaxID=1035309 RepID=A0A2C5WZV1_9PEZI|nr:Vacuolar protein sorting-associated protein 52 B [Ceratocystis fimbriata CBS 114723]
MWLDRLAVQANQSTSSLPPSRPHSSNSSINNNSNNAAVRRTPSNLSPYVTSQRTATGSALPPRGSSLTLATNKSTTSLLSAARKQNGNSSRHPSPGAPNPEALIQQLIEVEKDASIDVVPAHAIVDEDLALDFDFSGLSLSEFARSKIPSKSQDNDMALEYDAEKNRLDQLHSGIIDCDTILNSVEINLENFRSDLEFVSTDIETLQARSMALNVRLENRKTVERALGPVVEDLSIAPTVVSKISDGSFDEAWIKALHEVDRRAIAYKKEPHRQGKAWEELGPLLEKLVDKAIERIRDYMVAQIKALRSPNINAQILQQQNFIKFKAAFAFLYKHNSKLGDEICLAYMNTIRWYYLHHFTRYQKSLEKLKIHVFDKHDALGAEDPSRKSSILSVPSMRQQNPPHDTFNLGRRVDLLKTNNQTALPSYLAEDTQNYQYLEVPFRNFNLALVDNTTAEYTFLSSFFSPPMSLSTIQKHFNYIFEPTFTLGENTARALTSDTYDALGVLLSIRLTQHFAFELQRRRVPALDAYINNINMMLWPRLQKVMDFHSDSVHTLTATLPSKASSSSMSFAPHMVTQRFGQILHGILELSSEAADNEPVVTSLGRLRMEVESFLSKYAQVQSGGDQRKRSRFLHTNFSLIATIITDTAGKLAKEQESHYESLKAQFQESI